MLITVLTEAFCKIHSEPLISGLDEIAYGIWTKQSSKARDELFPNANLRMSGGCLYSKDFPKQTQVNYCQSCRIAEQEWEDFFGQS